MKKENPVSDRIDTVRCIDLSEVSSSADLHARLAKALGYPDPAAPDWDAFRIAHATAQKPLSTLILYNHRSFAEQFRKEMEILLNMCGNMGTNRYPNSGWVIFFDTIEKPALRDLQAAWWRLFDKAPGNWGGRGDPHLWKDLGVYFQGKPMPENEHEWQDQIHEAVEVLTNHRLAPQQRFFVEKYRASGMSGGFVHSDFWLRDGIPRLISRYRRMVAGEGF